MKTHRHICGDIGKGTNSEITVDLNKGCGHIFKHIKSKEHKCPKCKKKVTTLVYFPTAKINFITPVYKQIE